MGFNFNFLRDAKTEKKAAGKAFNFLKSIAVDTINTGKNAADVLNAGRQGVQGLADVAAQSAFGNDQSYQQALDRTSKAVNYSLDASRGAYSSKEANSDNIGNSLLKPLARNVGTYAPYALGSVGGEIAGAAGVTGTAAKLGVGAATDYGINTATSVLGQVGSGEKADLGKAAKEAIAPTVFGAALATAGEGVKAAKGGIKPVFADTGPKVVSKLAEETTVAGVKKVLGKDVPEELASSIAKAGDSNTVKTLLESTQAPPDKALNFLAPTESTPLETIAGNVSLPPAQAKGVTKVVPGEGMRQRGQFRTVQNAETLPISSRQAVGEIQPQTYKIMNIEDKLQLGRERLSADPAKVKQIVDTGLANGRWDAETSSLSLAMLEKAAKEGDKDLQNSLLKRTAPYGTDTGQANVLWRGMAKVYDPESMVKFAQNTVDDANKHSGLLTKGVNKLFNKSGYTLDDETKNFIRSSMDKVQGLADGPEKDQTMRQIFEAINQRVPAGASELFDAYRYNNLLSNPRSSLRNSATNLFNTLVTRPSTLATRASTDWFASTLFGKEREFYAKEVPAYYKGLFNSIGDAGEAAKEAFKGNMSEVGNPDLKSLRELRNKSLPKLLTVAPRFLDAQDKFFSTLISSGEFAAQQAKGVPEDVARKEADRVASYSLFRDATDPHNASGQGALLSKIDQFTDSVSKFGQKHKAFSWFVPFVRTPMNVTKQLIEFSPAGLATLPGSTNKVEQLSKAMSGTMLTMVGAKFALDGNTTWDAPKDENERQLFYASGKKPYSVKIGDKWVPMQYLGPYALAFALPAAARDAGQDSPLDAGVAAKIGATVQNSLKYFSQQTYVQGIANVVDLVSGEGGASLPSSLGFTAGQVLPFQGLQRYISSIIDPTFRKVEGGAVDKFFGSIEKDIPGLSKRLQPYTDLTGAESQRNLSDIVAPFSTGSEAKNPEDRQTIKANSEFLRTARRTSKLRSKANDDINEALGARDYGKAQQIAADYNAKVKEAFTPVVKKYRPYLSEELGQKYTDTKINLTRSSLAQRRYRMLTKEKTGRSLVNR